MRELDILNIIGNTLDDSSYLGDDCAYLNDLGLYVTHDTLVEDIHFSLYTTDFYNLGRKAVSVNLSDLAAALSQPLYITVSLSVPKKINYASINELYRGINDVCNEHNVKVIGGDVTGSEKVMISVCAIGKKISDFNISRSYARKDYSIIIAGESGSSSAGLYALMNFLYCNESLKNAHINPKAFVKEALQAAKNINTDVAAMDTSDGLMDALYKIAVASKHSIHLDFSKIPINPEVIKFSEHNNLDYKDFVFWGGEDYSLVIILPDEALASLNSNSFITIGRVLNKDNNPAVFVDYGSHTEKITADVFEKKSFNHFYTQEKIN